MNKCYSMVLESPNKFVKKEFPIPEAGNDELLLKIEMVSICGSDRHLFDGTHNASSFPKILGHELVGFVEEAGEKAAATYGVKKGDRVTVEPYIMCKECEHCLTGNYHFHQPRYNYGVSINCDTPPHLWGGYGQYMIVVPGSKVHKIDSNVPAEAACLSSVIGNGVRWVRTKAGASLGDSIVIIGAGAQGLASVIAANESGAHPIIVLGISKDKKKFELAKEFGADYLINTDLQDPVEEVKKITGGRMADIVIEGAGHPVTVRTAFKLPGPGGQIIMVGLTGNREINLNTDIIVNNELIVKGGHGQSWDVEDAVKLINSRKYAIEKMITHTYPLEDVQQAMEMFMDPGEDCVRVGLIP